MKKSNQVRTWIEIDTRSLRANLAELRRLIGKKRKLMAVVKSNAYGHGLVGTALALRKISPALWFGVDSLVEGLRLRREGIKNPIVVLGSTLPSLFQESARKNIILTISSFDSLLTAIRSKARIQAHFKIDTGMHRQGFFPEDVPKLIKVIRRFKLSPEGIYTHFAAAKDRTYPASTLEQFEKFKKVVRQFERAGFKNMVRHAAASGGTILFPETHLDMVRIGMSLWGCWPSSEARLNVLSGKFGLAKITLRPVLSWKTRAVEIKKIPAGALIGYDFTERVSRPSTIAVLPVGYWHGYDRRLSSLGAVLIRGKRAKVLGRVSMDMIVCDVTGISGTKAGDTAVLIGRQGKDEITAEEMARAIGTSPYEVLARINPLIERIYK